MLRRILLLFFVCCFWYFNAPAQSDLESEEVSTILLNPLPKEKVSIPAFLKDSELVLQALKQILDSDFDQMSLRGEEYLNRYNNPDYYCKLDSLPEFCWCGIDPMEGVGLIIRHDENEGIEDVRRELIQILQPFINNQGFVFDQKSKQFYKKSEFGTRMLDVQSHFSEEDILISLIWVWDRKKE